MLLDIEIFYQSVWRRAATVMLHEPEAGYVGAATVEYDDEYFLENAAADTFLNNAPVIDQRAVSVNYPVDLASIRTDRWPPFLLDLMPQGHARRKLAAAMGIPEDARSSDVGLLLRAAGSTIGNIRIVQAEQAERERLASAAPVGVTFEEVLDRSDRFLEVFDRFAMIASGSSGLQGEWPKVSMTLSVDGLLYPDALVADEDAAAHYIIKLVRSNKPEDEAILRLEGLYSEIAMELGLRVHAMSTYAQGVLAIPRFDRAVAKGGGTVRFGQESLVSALGVAEFGYLAHHERYIEVIKRCCTHPREEIVEYVCRDIANLAMGNSDNHGRNTALAKSPDGLISLTPLFDFAPMRLATESIVRSTKWACMARAGGDSDPDWHRVCEAIYPDDRNDAENLYDAIKTFAQGLKWVPEYVRRRTEDIPVLAARAVARCTEIAQSFHVEADDMRDFN